jgi:hypothetical protein
LIHAPSLRDVADLMQLFADLGKSLGNEFAFFVEDADFDGPLVAVFDLTTDSGHQRRRGADGLAMVSFVGDAQLEISPVVEQGDEVGYGAAGGKITEV